MKYEKQDKRKLCKDTTVSKNAVEIYIEPEYLSTDAEDTADIDLYTSLSIFVNNMPKVVSSMHEALATADTQKLVMLAKKFQQQCKDALLDKLSQKAESLYKSVETSGIARAEKELEQLTDMCNRMALSRPETVSMLIQIKDKKKSARAG